MPVVVFVNTGEEPFLSDSKGLHAGAVGGGHFVTITHYDKDTGQVSFDNSWRQESDHLGNNSVPADKMFRAMRATVHQECFRRRSCQWSQLRSDRLNRDCAVAYNG